MADYRLSRFAQAQIVEILAESEREFGTHARERYAALMIKAMEDAAADPEGLGVEHHHGLDQKVRSYHLRYSRKRVRDPPGRVGDPRHLLIFRIAEDGTIDILGVLHDKMLPRRAIRKILSQTAP